MIEVTVKFRYLILNEVSIKFYSGLFLIVFVFITIISIKMGEGGKLNEELYARIVRGILHAEPSAEEREPSKTYEMIERLRQVNKIFEIFNLIEVFEISQDSGN